METDALNKIIITGAGRSGTSFLVQLMTLMGEDTGYLSMTDSFEDQVRAGCEWQLMNYAKTSKEDAVNILNGAPRVIKSPDLYRNLPWLVRAGLKIEWVILPYRSFERIRDSAVVSGRYTGNPYEIQDNFVGAVTTCVELNIPLLLLSFKRMVKSGDYLFTKMSKIFDWEKPKFSRVYKKLCEYYRKLK